MANPSLKDFSPAVIARSTVQGTRMDWPGGVKPKAPKVKRGMNGTESAYAKHLELLKLAGEVRQYEFEKFKVRLADGAWFKPDFVVWFSDGRMEFHETKGFWREAARVRIKVAAELFPLVAFIAANRVEGAWQYERFGEVP